MPVYLCRCPYREQEDDVSRPALTAALLAALAGCMSLPQRINQDVHRLHAVAVVANRTHKDLCSTPAAAGMTRPPRCAPLLDCLRRVADATARCTSLQQQLAQSGQGEAASCTAPYEAALVICKSAGVSLVPEVGDAGGVGDAGR